MTMQLINWVAWACWALTWLCYAKWRKPTAIKESVFWCWANSAIFGLAFWCIGPIDVHGEFRTPIFTDTAVELLGICLTLFGLGLAVWARVHLAGNWSSHAELKVNHEYVTTGPYRYMSHPIYDGLLTACCGTAITNANMVGFIGTIALGVWLECKAVREERFLRRHGVRESL